MTIIIKNKSIGVVWIPPMGLSKQLGTKWEQPETLKGQVHNFRSFMSPPSLRKNNTNDKALPRNAPF